MKERLADARKGLVIYRKIIMTAALFGAAFLFLSCAAQALTLTERLELQGTVEQQWYEMRKARALAQGAPSFPAFADTLSAADIELKVQDTLLMTKALDQYGVPLLSLRMQAKINSTTSGSSDADGLTALFDALDNDAESVVEGLYRPFMVRSRLQNFYAFNAALHAERRALMEEARADLTGPGPHSMKLVAGPHYRCVTFRLAKENGQQGGNGPCSVHTLNENEFSLAVDSLGPVGVLSNIVETRTHFLLSRTLSKSPKSARVERIALPKKPFSTWWEEVRPGLIGNPDPFPEPPPAIGILLPPIRITPGSDWKATTLLNAPTPRMRHTAVWTGAEMIVWGGWDPATGYTGTGSRFTPALDVWVSIAASGALSPSPRADHSTVWSGTEMLVWAGEIAPKRPPEAISRPLPVCRLCPVPTEDGDGGDDVTTTSDSDTQFPRKTGTGGRYNPATNVWNDISPSGGARSQHQAVWSGSLMLTWGGRIDSGALGLSYDPVPFFNNWNAFDSGTSRTGHSAAWDGVRMLVWGGETLDTAAPMQTGKMYNPSVPSLVDTNLAGSPAARTEHTGVWMASGINRFIPWGGFDGTSYLNNGKQFRPSDNTWPEDVSPVNAPSPRSRHTAAVWSARMGVWGGFNGASFLNTGGIYDGFSGVWTTLPLLNAPSARADHTVVEKSLGMIIWGGLTASGTTNSGAVFTDFQ